MTMLGQVAAQPIDPLRLPVRDAGDMRLHGVEMAVMPLRRGGFTGAISTLRLGDLDLHLGRVDPFVAFATVKPGIAALQLPLENAESMILNGRRCGARIFCAYGPGAEMTRANPNASTNAVIFLPADSCEALLSPPLRLGLFRPRSDVMLQARSRDWRVLTEMLKEVAAGIEAAPDAFADANARQALRERLLQALRALLAGAEPDAKPARPRCTTRRRRLVAAVDSYLRAHIDRPVYTEDLCRVLGTSSSALAEAFRATLGVSPHRYLKLRRLALVRAALRDPTGPVPMVKAVALAHGFWHLGQFAADYRAQYGEAPSETLLKARLGRSIGDAPVPLALAS